MPHRDPDQQSAARKNQDATVPDKAVRHAPDVGASDEVRNSSLKLLNWEIFGHVIKQLRVKKDWNQEDLAKLANLNTSYISQIERGKKFNLSYESIINIANAFEIEPAWLLVLILNNNSRDHFINQLQNELRDEIEMRLKVSTQRPKR